MFEVNNKVFVPVPPSMGDCQELMRLNPVFNEAVKIKAERWNCDEMNVLGRRPIILEVDKELIMGPDETEILSPATDKDCLQ